MVKKNLFYTGLLALSQFIFPLISFPYSSRILGPEGLGSVNFIDSFTQYFILFSALGIPFYGIREIAKVKSDPILVKKVFNEILSIHLISTCIFSLIYFGLALIIPQLRAHLDIVIIGIIILFSNVFLFEWFFQGIGEFSYLAIRSLVVRLLSLGFLFVFFKMGSPPYVYYSIIASGFLINALLNIFFIRKYAPIAFSKSNLIAHIKPLLLILGTTLAVSIYLLLDVIVLGFIKGETAVGIYSTAIRIVKMPFALIVAISTVIIPQISIAYQKDNQLEIKELLHKSLTFILLITIPISVGIYISAGFLVMIFAGEKFTGAIIPLQILSPVMLLVGLNNIFGFQILTPIGEEKKLLHAVLIGMAFSIAFNIFLIPRFSSNGAATTNLLTECVVTFICYLFVRKRISLPFDIKTLIQCILGSLFFFPIAFLIRKLNLDYLYKEVAIITTCGIFYLAFIWFFIKNIYVLNVKKLINNKLSLSY